MQSEPSLLATPLRVVFMGTPAFAVPGLTALLEAQDMVVVGVVTQPDRPSGRGQQLTPSPIALLAQAKGVLVFKPERLRADASVKKALHDLNADVFVTIAFGHLLDAEVLAMPRLGTVNVHASLLPRYRGANPIQWALLNGETTTGLTTMLTELGLDSGPMLLTHSEAINPTDTTATLSERLSKASGPLLLTTLRQWALGALKPIAQEEALATHAPKLTKAQGTLDFTLPAQVVERSLRALQPWPGATVMAKLQRVKVLQATALPAVEWTNDQEFREGRVVGIDSLGVLVQCGQQTLLRLTQVHPENRKAMSALDWFRGLSDDVYLKALV
ncbi:MAG: methionyl-tRNA formyltransferase [Vampirovibrionales bacterium]